MDVGGDIGTRDKILHAAVVMVGEDPNANLSVRAVAARAGVSIGSLRHHYPTQRGLRDAVISTIYDATASDTGIHDRTVPARDRLLACIGDVLAPTGVGDQARTAWRKIFQHFIDPEPTAEVRAAYAALDRGARHRVENWLTILTDEGALPAGDNARRARFLVTVMNGLSIERALPSTESVQITEIETLTMAIDYVLSDGST